MLHANSKTNFKKGGTRPERKRIVEADADPGAEFQARLYLYYAKQGKQKLLLWEQCTRH
jgi:hypothetical protein